MGDTAQAGRQLRLPQPLTRLVRLAASLKKLPSAGGIGFQEWCGGRQGSTHFSPNRETLFSQINGGLHHRRQGQTAIARLHPGKTGHCSRHPRAEQAAQGPFPIHAAVGVEKEIRARGLRRHFTEIQSHRLAAAHGQSLGRRGLPSHCAAFVPACFSSSLYPCSQNCSLRFWSDSTFRKARSTEISI